MQMTSPLTDLEKQKRLRDIKTQIQVACPDLKVTEITEHFLAAFVVKFELKESTPPDNDVPVEELESLQTPIRRKLGSC